MAEFQTNAGSSSVRALERRDALVRWARRFAVGAVAAAVIFSGHRGYAVWRKNHLAQQTVAFVRQNDPESAVLTARRLLELEPDNPIACRAMAEMAERAGQPAAVSWRQRLAQREPTLANQIALAKTAVRFGQGDLAEFILQAVPESSRQCAAYQQVAAAHALTRQDPVAAEAYFAAALALAPNDSQIAVNLAILQLASSDPKMSADARATLERLTGEPSVHLEALRALAALALAKGDRTAAKKYTSALQSDPGANFSDALLYFQAVQGTDAAAGALENLQAKAAGSATTVAELLPWLNRHGLTSEAIAWGSTLPPKIRATQPVPLALAESFSFAQDWNALSAFVTGKNWGEFEALRLAVESHALHRLSPPDRPSMEAKTAWQSALKAARKHPEQLVTIAQLAEGWGYNSEAEDAWWAIANGNANPRAALVTLQRFYRSKQDTHGLFRVAKRALELNPNDLVAANNCASLGLLLTGDSTARRLASKLHSEHPANRAFAATYAFALRCEGKFAEGLRVMEGLKEDELQYPSIAAYYVVMLVESGKLDRARAYLANAKTAALLPEEKELLESAARKLG